MKKFIIPAYTFTPGASGVGTVNLSGISSFDKKYLIAIINQTRGVTIYATGSSPLRYTDVTGNVVTLFFDTTTHVNTDILQVVYEDETTAQIVSSVQLPASLGAKTTANAMAVSLASDQASIPVAATLTAETTKVIGTVNTKAALNVTGSGTTGTVSTVITLTAPSNAVGFILTNLDTSTANIRWALGRTATTTVGAQLQSGRDTGYLPFGGNVSIVSESGTQNYDIAWISQ